jgi:hypothetical protein
VSTAYDFAYLKGLVQKKLQGDSYFSVTDIEDALNESQDDLAIFTKANLTSTPLVLTVGQDTYDWPADALIIVGVNYNGVELDEITPEEWRRIGGLAPNNVGNPLAPSAFAVQGKKIILFPKPGDSTPPCLLYYVPKPAELTLDTQVPAVDRVFTKAWVHLALSNLLEMDAARHAEAEYHYKMYLARRAENAVNQNSSRKRKFRNTYPRAVRFP